ncbi:MAG: adenylate/guanylate cyclase domain-containing protein [Calditrichaeota bacterium]|nr:adenylate/guanylate cyclase domain-containing protein [Calditrichota bacterium]
MSLKLKISLGVIIIITLIMVTSLFLIQSDFEKRVNEKITAQFQSSRNIFNRFLQRDVELLSQAISITTFGSTFSENLRTRDEATILVAIADAHFQVGGIFDIMIVTDFNYNTIAFFDAFATDSTENLVGRNFADHPAIQDLYSTSEDAAFQLRTLLIGSKLYQVYADEVATELGTQGFVIIGREVNNTMADDLQRSLNTDFSFFLDKRAVGSSLQRQKRLALEEYINGIDSLNKVVLSDSAVSRQTSLDNEQFLINFQEMDAANHAYYVQAVSYDKEFETFAGVQMLIIAIGAFGIVIGILYSVFFGNRITNPVQKLVWAVGEIEQENYNVNVDVQSTDEIGRLSKAFNEMARGLGERFELLKFVSKNTISMIQNKGVGNLKLGGERKYLTMFFSDIRGFTAFSEKRQPEEVIEMLNLYLRRQAEIVHKYGGDIDKFVGDELMAIFEGKDAELNSVLCAYEIQHRISKLNEEFQNDIFVGIGINAGDVVSGNMGSEDRIDHTVLGNHVNLAARLCSKAGPTQTIISESVYNALEDKSIASPLEPIEVKGISEPVQIYEVHYSKEQIS